MVLRCIVKCVSLKNGCELNKQIYEKFTTNIMHSTL